MPRTEQRDPRFFDLLLLWGRTRLPAFLGNLRVWQASSYSPLVLDLPATRGRRRAEVTDVVGTIRPTEGLSC